MLKRLIGRIRTLMRRDPNKVTPQQVVDRVLEVNAREYGTAQAHLDTTPKIKKADAARLEGVKSGIRKSTREIEWGGEEVLLTHPAYKAAYDEQCEINEDNIERTGQAYYTSGPTTEEWSIIEALRLLRLMRDNQKDAYQWLLDNHSFVVFRFWDEAQKIEKKHNLRKEVKNV